MSVQTAGAAAPFPDMEQSWFAYQESVAYLVDKGSIAGHPDGNFHPKDTVNRAEFLKLVFRSRTDAEPTTGRCFSDVPEDAWYAPYVCAAKRRKVVSGYAVGSRSVFKAEQPITFAEAIKMTLLAYGKDVREGRGEEWFAAYVEAIDRLGVLPDWSYKPNDPLSRERAADLIARFLRHEQDGIASNESSGCRERRAGGISQTLPVNGQERSYLLSLRDDQDHDRPKPLIVAFHGRTNANDRVRGYYGLDKTADDYIVAYPAGIPTGNGSFSWSDPGDKASALRDYAFFDAIVREIAGKTCVDLDRIYVVGHSLGAWFANSVACARGGIVRASATVGGSTTMTGCTGPSAALIINNPKDASSPQTNAEKMRDVRMAENRCSQTSKPVSPSSLNCMQYDACTSNPVTFCPHTIDSDPYSGYYPHLWPDGTAQAIVKFFAAL